jgi:ABC-2 type transport system permease protein
MLAKAWACVLKDARIDASYKLSFVVDAIDGLLLVAAYALLAGLFGDQTLDGFSALGFVLIGVAGNTAVMTALVCFSQAVRGLQTAGAIKAVLATPTPPVVVVLLSSIYPFFRAGLDLAVWLLVAWALGAPIVALSLSSMAAIVLIVVASAAAMAGLGFGSAAFAVVFKRGDPIVWFYGAVSMLMGGVLFPLSALPPYLAQAGRLLPTTHALEALRVVLLDGGGVSAIGSPLLALTLLAVIGVPAGLGALSWSVRQARRTGTLGHV